MAEYSKFEGVQQEEHLDSILKLLVSLEDQLSLTQSKLRGGFHAEVKVPSSTPRVSQV